MFKTQPGIYGPILPTRARRDLVTATTDKQQLMIRSINTQANKLNKITRGRG